MRADTTDVAFRLLLTLGELWDSLQGASIDPTTRGLHLNREYLGGYTRFSAGPSSHARLVVEWNATSRHLRVLRCAEWPGFEQTISATVAHIRGEARSKGIGDEVDRQLVSACKDPAPCKRTVLAQAMVPSAPSSPGTAVRSRAG